MGYDYGALLASKTPQKDVLGADEIIAALDHLPRTVTNRILIDAHKTILRKVVRPDLKAVLSSFSPASRKGVSVVRARGTKTGIYIGINTNAYWLRFVDKGTKMRETKQSTRTRRKTKRYNNIGRLGRQGGGANRGMVVGDNRITNLLEQKAETVLKEVQFNYGDMIIEALNKQLQKNKLKYPHL